MSRRARQRREAVEAKRISELPWSEIGPAHDDDDGDFDMLANYRDHEIPAPMEDAQCQQ